MNKKIADHNKGYGILKYIVSGSTKNNGVTQENDTDFLNEYFENYWGDVTDAGQYMKILDFLEETKS